ncbi:MAG: hypothetical protein JOY71_03640 [Acetobacteraceae bacterium]|nr:hypothetical protein [Acetobacteraceae bacterium]MBV8521215.1 hypothetical protein [Acetobacteraceae bacterium]MBV8590334.1 hypothetical protein [Acetobacteraceae bacterium]
MGYELRNNGRRLGTFDRPEDALAQVRVMMKRDPDCEPEVLDAHTGRAFEPAASINWRDELANTIVF